MTWNSGHMARPQPGDSCIILTDAYPEPVQITGADVRADEREREMLDIGSEPMPVRRSEFDWHFIMVAETHPGIVAKLRAVWGDVEAEMPTPRTKIALAKVLRTMADTLDADADAPLSSQ